MIRYELSIMQGETTNTIYHFIEAYQSMRGPLILKQPFSSKPLAIIDEPVDIGRRSFALRSYLEGEWPTELGGLGKSFFAELMVFQALNLISDNSVSVHLCPEALDKTNHRQVGGDIIIGRSLGKEFIPWLIIDVTRMELAQKSHPYGMNNAIITPVATLSLADMFKGCNVNSERYIDNVLLDIVEGKIDFSSLASVDSLGGEYLFELVINSLPLSLVDLRSYLDTQWNDYKRDKRSSYWQQLDMLQIAHAVSSVCKFSNHLAECGVNGIGPNLLEVPAAMMRILSRKYDIVRFYRSKSSQYV